MPFQLKSKFKPTGDQPQATLRLTLGLRQGEKHQVLLGATGSGKTFSMACVVEQTQKPTLVISHNKTLAAQLAQEFKEFFPNNAVHYFVSYYDYYQPEAYLPTTDTYIAKETQINQEIDRLRHLATQSLLTRRDVLIVASVSCIYGLGSPADYQNLSRTFFVEKNDASLKQILRELVAIQYSRNDLELKRGCFSLKGDSLEIYPPSGEEIFRLEFFGDSLEKISRLHHLTKQTIDSEPIKTITIFPAKHWLAPQDRLLNTFAGIEQELKERVAYFKKQQKLVEAQRIQQRVNYDLETMQTTGYVNGIENYSRYLNARPPGYPPDTLIDFFKYAYADNWLMFIDESHMTVPQIRGMSSGDRQRKQVLVDFGFRLPSALDNRPLRFEEFNEKIPQVIYVSATPQDYEVNQAGPKNIAEQLIRPTNIIDPEIKIKPSGNQINNLIAEIEARVKKRQRVLITTLTKKMAEDLAEFLIERGIKVHYLHSEIKTIERLDILKKLRQGEYDVVVGINLLREGLDLPEVSLVAILDADKEGFLRSETSLIQTIGRASRHPEGRVIMYADQITGSIKRAVAETNRRRKIQTAYNLKHNLTPRIIKKKIQTNFFGLSTKSQPADAIKLSRLSQEDLKRLTEELSEQMKLAADNLEFEKAIELRNEIKRLKLEKNKSGR